VVTKRQAKVGRALGYFANFYYIPRRCCDETPLGIAVCRRCGQEFSMIDVAGRRNYFRMVSHTSKHVGERLRLEEARGCKHPGQ